MASRDGIQIWFFNPNFAPDIPSVEPFQALEKRNQIKPWHIYACRV